MGLVVAILFRMRDRALSEWPLSIQPNSAIAILTTVGKAAMLVCVASCISQLKWRHMQLGPQPLRHLQIFDDASRGPWGSTTMLFRVSQVSILGWCLALVTVAGLGIEPSAQNILDFQLRTINLTNITAEISIAHSWDSKAFLQQEGGINGEMAMTLGLPHLQGVVLNGLSGQVLPPSFACPSPAVNCTWEPFKSLGICTDFRNVTEGVTRNCTGDGIKESCRYENITGWLEQDTTARLGGEDEVDYNPKLEYQDPGNTYSRQTQTLYTGYGTSGGSLNGPWLIVRHDSTAWQRSERDTVPPFPHIFTATFSFCEKTYTGVRTADPVSKGQLDSKIEITSRPLEFRSVANTSIHSSFTDFLLSTADNSSSYTVTKASEDGLKKYLASVLRRTAFKYTASSSRSLGYTYDTAMNVDFLFQNSDSLELIANNLADTLTNLIRNDNTGDNNAATKTTGTAFGTEQFVVIRWEWLILPVLETLLTSVLLIVCIIQTSVRVTTGYGTQGKQPQPLLKESVMAYLAYPLIGWTEDEVAVRGKQTAGKLEDLAKGMNARFAVDDAGRWRFWRS